MPTTRILVSHVQLCSHLISSPMSELTTSLLTCISPPTQRLAWQSVHHTYRSSQIYASCLAMDIQVSVTLFVPIDSKLDTPAHVPPRFNLAIVFVDGHGHFLLPGPAGTSPEP